MSNNDFYFRYEFICINCNVPFKFDYKNEAIEKATCPVCDQSNTTPEKITKIQEIQSK